MRLLFITAFVAGRNHCRPAWPLPSTPLRRHRSQMFHQNEKSLLSLCRPSASETIRYHHSRRMHWPWRSSHLRVYIVQYDVFSRLLQDRILLLGSEVNDDVANVMVSQMLYLAAEDPKADITLYINSPGGSVQAGLAIFDAMQYVPCDVSTVCFGMAASMGAFLLSAGTKGKRKSLPNSRIMIHQPLGGAQGEATELEITAALMLHTKEVLNTYLSEFTSQPIDKIRVDTDRDFYLTPEDAKHYGLIDEVITHKNMIPRPKVPELRVTPPISIYDLGPVRTQTRSSSGGDGSDGLYDPRRPLPL